jgi:hypothetical protein
MPAAPRHPYARLALLLSLALHAIALAAFVLGQWAVGPRTHDGPPMEVAFFEAPVAEPRAGPGTPSPGAAVPAHLLPTLAPPPFPISALLTAVELPPALPGGLRPPLAPTAPVRPIEHRDPAGAGPSATGVSQPRPPARDPAGPATSFFGVPAAATARSVVYVIDRSASMGANGRLARARREVVASLRQLPPSARFQVIAYNRAAEPLPPGSLLPATPDAIEAAERALDALEAEGGDEHGGALCRALSLGPDVIYFLTDADDLKPEDVARVKRLNKGRVAIHSVCLSAAPPDGMMGRLARENGGQFQALR